MNKENIKSALICCMALYSWPFLFFYFGICILEYISKDLNLIATYNACSAMSMFLSIIVLSNALIMIVLFIIYMFMVGKEKKDKDENLLKKDLPLESQKVVEDFVNSLVDDEKK